MIGVWLSAGCLVSEVDLGGSAQDAGPNDGGASTQPWLRLQPEIVSFPPVAVGAAATRVVEISNVGDGQVRVRDVFLVADAPGSFDLPAADADGRLPALPVDIAAGARAEALRFDVRLRCPRAGLVAATLHVLTDSPSQPRASLAVTGECVQPRLEASPLVLDFGAQAVGLRVRRKLRVENPGPSTVALLALAFVEPGSSPDFRVERAPAGLDCDLAGRACAGRHALQPASAVSVEVSYLPPDEGGDAARLVLHSDVSSPQLQEVLLLGNGATGACQGVTLWARAPEAGLQDWLRYPPQGTPLQLAAGSRLEVEARGLPTGHDDETWQTRFSVTEHPYDHRRPLVPTGAGRGVDVLVDAAGTWAIQLEVEAPGSGQSCRAAQLPLWAVATEALRLELAWETPGDPDPLDHGLGAGPDLDLHLLHPAGAWFAAPWDCHFACRSPDWGRPLYAGDNPLLHADDQDGWGPEVISLHDVPAGELLRVGVHVYAHHGYGASAVTLRTYLRGTLHAEKRRTLPAERAFWDALLVEPGAGTVVALDRLLLPGPQPPAKHPSPNLP